MNDRETIALGVTGGIAVYKACDLVRRLRDEGFDVKVMMTRSACEFVTPLTFETLSGQPVVTDQFQAPEEYGINHIGLARRAAVVLIAPATANVIGKIAQGIADDFLTTLVTATYAPLCLAPSMNTAMWRAEAVQANVRTLLARGAFVVPPGSGSLACGEEGVGRMADVGDVVREVRRIVTRRASLQGVKVLVNAGPTREPIDAVRFVSNRSTGRMGIALASAARDRGAEVTLVMGPSELPMPQRVAVVRVTTAAQMKEATLEAAASADVAVLSAAVSDYAPASPAGGKIKKTGAATVLEMVPTDDVLATLSRTRRPAVLVGFAAEHGDPTAEARRKCVAKGCDLVVGNDVSGSDAGFGTDTNRAVLAFDDGRVEPTPLESKRELAERILDAALSILRARKAPATVRPESADLA